MVYVDSYMSAVHEGVTTPPPNPGTSNDQYTKRTHRENHANPTLGSTPFPTLPSTNHQNNLSTPIKVKGLKSYLQDYDRDKTQYLINGFSQGFALEFEGPREPSFCSNIKLSLDNPGRVQDKIHKELVCNRVAGPATKLRLVYKNSSA
jgi:hypothetical protein